MPHIHPTGLYYQCVNPHTLHAQRLQREFLLTSTQTHPSAREVLLQCSAKECSRQFMQGRKPF
jgi:hypothetical protein